jgi:hypothetical protein
VVVTLTKSYLHTLLATLYIHLDRLPRKRRTEKGLVIETLLEKHRERQSKLAFQAIEKGDEQLPSCLPLNP